MVLSMIRKPIRKINTFVSRSMFNLIEVSPPLFARIFGKTRGYFKYLVHGCQEVSSLAPAIDVRRSVIKAMW